MIFQFLISVFIFISIAVVICGCVYKNWYLLGAGFVTLILLIINPFSFHSGGNMSEVSHKFQSELVLPERVDSDRVSSEQSLQDARERLKEESKQVEEKINND